MSKVVFFSIILPVFNRARLINRALNSIFSQTCDDFEVIVVDDGSTDDILNVLKQYKDKINLIHQDNKGPGAARNAGIISAKGKYVTFLDSDDEWFPWTLSVIREVIEKNNYPSFLAGRVLQFSDKAESLGAVSPSQIIFHHYDDYLASSKDNVWVPTTTVAIKKKLMENIRFEQKKMNCEDLDLWLKLGVSPLFVFIDNPVLAVYYRSKDSETGSIEKICDGAIHMLQSESSGIYPGGKERQKERWKIISNNIRPVCMACLHNSKFSMGWAFYKSMFKWNLLLGKFKFIFGYPLLLFWRKVN